MHRPYPVAVERLHPKVEIRRSRGHLRVCHPTMLLALGAVSRVAVEVARDCVHNGVLDFVQNIQLLCVKMHMPCLLD